MTSLKEFNKKTVDSTIKRLIKIARFSPPNKDYLGIAQGPFEYKEIRDLYDKKIKLADHVDVVEKVIENALDNGAKRTAGLLESSEAYTFLKTSSNVETEGKGSLIHLSLRALLSKGASGHLTCSSRILRNFDHSKAAQEAGIIASEAQYPKAVKAGKYDIIFKPLAFANLLSLIGEASSAFAVESGLSFLKNKINKQIASKHATFLDDPTIPNGIGSIKFDGEGYPSKKKILIENGVFKTYLHNTSTAKKYKTKTTGNAGIIAPVPFNLILKKSDWKIEEMIQEVKKGLMVTNLWYTRFKNYATGEFSTIPRDGIFLIENGKIKCPVKGIRISETLPNVLKNIYAIGNNQSQIISWEISTPTTTADVLVKNLNVTKPLE